MRPETKGEQVAISFCNIKKGWIQDFPNKPFISSGSANFQLLARADSCDQYYSIADLIW
jgi:hypothetical protein